jgi:diguanylate cyclase (GGDEF)-like protein
MQRYLDFLSRQPKYQIFLTAILLVAFIGVIDYVTGPDLSVFIFYLIPVFMGTWFIGKRTGILLALLSAATWSLADRIYTHALLPYWNLAMEVIFFMLMTFILSVLKKSLETERQLARIDYLTGAINRRYFIELAESEIRRAQRYQRPFSTAYIDVDNFKTINDNLGHHEGDELLTIMVSTIRAHIRTTDIIARLGGDEFIILFPETDIETAQKAIEKLQLQLMNVMAQRNWPATFTIGMVTFLYPPQSVDQLIKLADDLMYRGKSKGKNTITYEVFGR